MLNYVHPDKNFSSKIAYRVSFERYQPLLSFYHLFSQFWIAFMRIFSTIFMTQKFHYTILLHKTHIGLEAQLNINQMTWFLNCDHFIYKSSQKSPGSQYLKTSCILNHPNVFGWAQTSYFWRVWLNFFLYAFLNICDIEFVWHLNVLYKVLIIYLEKLWESDVLIKGSVRFTFRYVTDEYLF